MAKKTQHPEISSSLFRAMMAALTHIKGEVDVISFPEAEFEFGGQGRRVTVRVTTLEAKIYEIFVYEVREGDSWQVTESFVVQEKGEWTMSNQKFDARKILYAGTEEHKLYGQKNADFCSALNEGARFAFMADKYGQLGGDGEEFDTYYSFIVLETGELMPLPIIFDAYGVDYRLEVGIYNPASGYSGHDATEAQMAEYLTGLFGEQFIGAIHDVVELDKKRMVKINGAFISVIREFAPWQKPEEAQGVLEFTNNLWDEDVDPAKLVNARWLIQNVLLGQAPGFLVVDAAREYVFAELKEAVKTASRVKDLILNFGDWPTELSEVWELAKKAADRKDRQLIEHWGQCMVIYHNTGFWPLIHARTWQTPLWVNVSNIRSQTHQLIIGGLGGRLEQMADWPEDTQWLVALARAMKRGSVASRSWKKSWSNGQGHDRKVVFVWEDPETGLTFSNTSGDRNGEKVSGQVEVYNRHFGIS